MGWEKFVCFISQIAGLTRPRVVKSCFLRSSDLGLERNTQHGGHSYHLAIRRCQSVILSGNG